MVEVALGAMPTVEAGVGVRVGVRVRVRGGVPEGVGEGVGVSEAELL